MTHTREKGYTFRSNSDKSVKYIKIKFAYRSFFSFETGVCLCKHDGRLSIDPIFIKILLSK